MDSWRSCVVNTNIFFISSTCSFLCQMWTSLLNFSHAVGSVHCSQWWTYGTQELHWCKLHCELTVQMPYRSNWHCLQFYSVNKSRSAVWTGGEPVSVERTAWTYQSCGDGPQSTVPPLPCTTFPHTSGALSQVEFPGLPVVVEWKLVASYILI